MKKALLICTALLLVLVLSAGMGVAQDLSDNWCFEGQPWGDGRCNDPDPFVTDYMWLAGWCHAQVENGNLDMTVDECMSVPGPATTAVDDEFRSGKSDHIGCLDGRMGPETGLLANDVGEGLYIVDYTNFHGHPGAELTVRSNGAFSYAVRSPGTYEFTYTLNDGSTANVKLYACSGKHKEEHDDDEDK